MGNSPATTSPDFSELFRSPHFERLRCRLIRMFARRGCAIPEDLADETLGRATSRFLDVGRTYEGNPTHFVYGVARNVYLEYSRHPRTVPYERELYAESTPRPKGEVARDEERHVCLERCIDKLGVEDRYLISQYYLYDKGAGIAWRRKLADELQMGVNALRIKACRIRQGLRACVAGCVKRRLHGLQGDLEGRSRDEGD